MKEYQVRQLFLIISNGFHSFTYDDFKVELWRDLLDHVPFAHAEANLRQYMLDRENKFPPHPGVLAASKVQSAAGPDIPNAEETRRMLEKREAEIKQLTIVPPTEEQRERVRLACAKTKLLR